MYSIWVQSIDPPIRNTYLEWASDSYLLVQRQATFLYSVSYPPNLSNRVLFARILRTSNFLWTATILKGCSLLRMRRGAECWQLKRRLPPTVTTNRLRSLQSAPLSMLLWLHKGKIITPSGQYTFFCVCTSSIHSAPGAVQVRLHVALCCIALPFLGRQHELTFVGAIS